MMKTILSLPCVILVLLTGCTSLMGGYNYNLEVRNIGTERVNDCEVSSASGFSHEPGVLIPTAGKTIAGPFKFSYADKWTVSWKTSDGKKITKILDLTKAFPNSFKGRLVFTIDKDNNLAYFTEKFYGQ